MALYVKKLGTGSHSFRLSNGKKVSVNSGGYVECELSDLGNQSDCYVELSREEIKKHNSQTPLKRETARFEESLRLESWVLNPDWKPGLGVFAYTPSDKLGLESVLANLKETEEICKINLQEIWLGWRNEVKRDPMNEKVLTEPNDRFLEPIARAQAALNVVKKEIKEIESRIAALVEVQEDPSILAELRRRKFMQGHMKRDKGLYKTCDGYAVEYKAGKPFIPDLNISLREYLDKVKTYKNEKSAAKKAESAKARQEFLDARKEKRLRQSNEVSH